MVRRILDENAGILKTISDILALEALKDPILFPIFPTNDEIVMFSDYSRGSGKHRSYSFLVTSSSEVTRFNQERVLLRSRLSLQKRRMSFKGLNDKVKLNSLPEFLQLAGTLSGLLLTFVVDSAPEVLFADLFREVSPELQEVKRATLEELLRVAFLGGISLMVSTQGHTLASWFTDEDNIVATDKLKQQFGKIAQAGLNLMYSDGNAPLLSFGITSIDDGTLDLEDLVAIPDLMAGATCELLDRLAINGMRVASHLALTPPKVTRKTDFICSWAAQQQRLRKFAVSIQRSRSAGTWSPTFFSMQKHRSSLCLPSTE